MTAGAAPTAAPPAWPRAAGAGGPGALLLPLATGLLLAAATPPALGPVVPFVALVPLALALATLPAGPAGAARAAGAGLLAGALQHAWGLRWLPGTLTAVAGGALGWASFAAVVAALAAATAAAAVALHALLTARRPLPVALALPLAWTALEWTVAHVPFGWAFPWAPLGLGLAAWPEALGLAELVGVVGVTAWLAAVNGLAAEAVLRARSAGSARAAAVFAGAAALAAVLPVAGGILRARTLDAPSAGSAAALALHVPPRASAAERARIGIDGIERALQGLEPGSVDVVVLPEMVVPIDLRSPAGIAHRRGLVLRAQGAGAPLLAGSLGVDAGAEHNSAVLVRAEDAADLEGPFSFRADKRRLVPGVERASAVRAPWLAERAAGYASGEGWPVARVGGLDLGALICFEVAFPQDARRLVRGGARALAALTSDAWFDPALDAAATAPSGTRRAGIAQQTAHLTMRVVETRTGAVRASNGGPALVLDPTGRVVAAAAAGAVVGEVRAAARPTLFVRTGDLVGPAALGLLLLLLVLG